MEIEQIIASIDRIDAILEANRKDMMILRQERQALYDKLVSLSRKYDPERPDTHTS